MCCFRGWRPEGQELFLLRLGEVLDSGTTLCFRARLQQLNVAALGPDDVCTAGLVGRPFPGSAQAPALEGPTMGTQCSCGAPVRHLFTAVPAASHRVAKQRKGEGGRHGDYSYHPRLRGHHSETPEITRRPFEGDQFWPVRLLL